jgi:HEAT repeat protein
MKKSYLELLEILQDDSLPLPAQRFAELSDLDKEQQRQFASVWQSISSERKMQILRVMGQQALDRFELSFEAVNRIAILDPDSQIRSIAIENLWESEDPSLVPILLESLVVEGDDRIRAVAATALGRFVWLGEIDEITPELLQQIELGLLAACRDDDSHEVRRRSLESIGYSSHDEVPDQIEEAYRSTNEQLQQSAVLAMGRSANERWADYILAELTNPNPLIRMEAARAAGELEVREATMPLIDLLQDVNDGIRQAAIWALAELGGEDAVNALIELADNSDDSALQDVIQEAIDHMTFIEGSRDLLLFDFDEDNNFKAPES